MGAEKDLKPTLFFIGDLFRGFRARVFWYVTVLMMGLAVFFTGVTIYQQSNLLKQDLLSKGTALAENLAHDSQLGIFTENRDFIEPALRRSAGREEDVLYVAVYSVNGRALGVSGKKEFIREASPALIEEAKKGTVIWQERVVNGAGVYELRAPVFVSKGYKAEEMVVDIGRESQGAGEPEGGAITSGKGKLIGMVQVGLSLKKVEERIRDIIWTSISIMALSFPVGLLFTYLVVRMIARPLIALKKGVEAIEQGKEYIRIETHSRDDIGQLALSFDRMVESLRKKDEEIMRHVKELSALNVVSWALNRSLDLRTTLHDALKEVLSVTGMTAGWIYLASDDGSVFNISAYIGIEEGFVREIDGLEPGEGIAGRVCISGEPIFVEDISSDERVSRQALRNAGFKGFVSIPLSYKDKVKGTLNLASDLTHSFSKDEIYLLYSMGNLIGAAVENSMLYERLKKNLEEIERTQDKLIRTARLASLGELSANIAHEINNPLTGVLTHTSMLMEDMPDTGPNKKRLNIIYDETMRIRYIVRNLLDFARQSEPKREDVCIVNVIKDTIMLIAHLAKVSNVKIVEDFAHSGLMVSIDSAQIKQVVLNLFNNAMYAMPGGGTMTIGVAPEPGYAVVHVRDTGSGIPPEIMHRVFDPFFTTKPETKGTGLGLSVSHGIIEKHDGRIAVASEVGKGTTFTIRLPLLSG